MFVFYPSNSFVVLYRYCFCVFELYVLMLTNICMSQFVISRVISRAPGLKLVVETLITSLRPIGNIVLICCAFFIVFGILGVQVVYIHAQSLIQTGAGLEQDTIPQHRHVSHVATQCTRRVYASANTRGESVLPFEA